MAQQFAETLRFRGNQMMRANDCVDPLPEVASRARRAQSTLSEAHKQIFLRVLATLRSEAPRQYLVFVETCLREPPTSTGELADRYGTTMENIRLAKMRAWCYMRREAGSWVDGFVQVLRET